MAKRIVYIISNIDKAVHFEWLLEYLNKERFSLKFILLNPKDSYLECYLRKNKVPVERIPLRGKKDLISATIKIYILLKIWKADIVHTHLFEANLAGLTAAWLAGIHKRIYTRHHPDHRDFPKAIKYDKYCDWLATDIITPSAITREILKNLERVSHQKIHLIHHPFKLVEFNNVPQERISALRQKYGIDNLYPVIGVISRQVQWKGIQYIIPAFKKLLKLYANAHLILANAVGGDAAAEIKELLKILPDGSFTEITFEYDSAALYKLFNIFVHVPIGEDSESFGQTYVESLAAGIPSVFTLSGVATEFIQSGQNALVVDYKNTPQIYEAILKLLTDKNLTEQLIKNGKESVRQFSLENIVPMLERLYAQD